MDIYIEYVIIDNMVINSLLLLGAFKTLRRKTVKWKILLAAAIGTVLAALLPLFPLAAPFAVLVKFLTGFLMVFTAGDFKKFKDYVFTFFVFLAYTFLLGGICTALLYGAADVSDALTVNYMSDFPVGLVVLAAALFVWFVYSVCRVIFRQKDYEGFTRKAELDILGRKYTARAFIDTGNMLYDSDSGLPVVVVNKSLIADALADMIVSGGKTGAHYIEISTAAGAAKMLVLSPEKLVIYHKGDKDANIIDKFRIGVSNEELKFDMLLHPGIL